MPYQVRVAEFRLGHYQKKGESLPMGENLRVVPTQPGRPLVAPRHVADESACNQQLHDLRRAIANFEANYVAHPLLMR